MADWTYPGMRGRLARPPREGERADGDAYIERRILEVLGKESRPLATSEIVCCMLGGQVAKKLGLTSDRVKAYLNHMTTSGILTKREQEETGQWAPGNKTRKYMYYSINRSKR